MKSYIGVLANYRKGVYLLLVVCASGLIWLNWLPEIFITTADRLYESDKEFVIPWMIVTIFLIPSSMSTQYITLLFNFKEVEGLSDDQQDNINCFVQAKFSHVRFSLLMYLIIANAIVGMFVFYTNTPDQIVRTLTVVGLASIISMLDMFFLLNDMKALHEHKTEIADELEQKKRQAQRHEELFI
jgi:hypothetical protein